MIRSANGRRQRPVTPSARRARITRSGPSPPPARAARSARASSPARVAARAAVPNGPRDSALTGWATSRLNSTQARSSRSHRSSRASVAVTTRPEIGSCGAGLRLSRNVHEHDGAPEGSSRISAMLAMSRAPHNG